MSTQTSPTRARLALARAHLREAVRLLREGRAQLLAGARDESLTEDDRAELGTAADYVTVSLGWLKTLGRIGPVLERLTAEKKEG